MKGWAIVLGILTFASILSLSTVSAEEPYFDQDLGDKYSMKIQFVFTGEAETVHWDFGDGEFSDEMDPIHEYKEKGTYYVVQTAVNGSGNDEKRSVAVYRVAVMGYPEITFDSAGGSQVETIKQTAFNVSAEMPSDPVREGWEFTGWYTDKELTVPMDWNSGIKKSMTLYAGWREYLTLVYDTGDGSYSVKIPYGTVPDIPETPSKDGYRFVCWLNNGSEYSFDEPLLSNTVLTAEWDAVHDTSGGSSGGKGKGVAVGASTVAGVLACTLALSIAAIFITRRH